MWVFHDTVSVKCKYAVNSSSQLNKNLASECLPCTLHLNACIMKLPMNELKCNSLQSHLPNISSMKIVCEKCESIPNALLPVWKPEQQQQQQQLPLKQFHPKLINVQKCKMFAYVCLGRMKFHDMVELIFSDRWIKSRQNFACFQKQFANL